MGIDSKVRDEMYDYILTNWPKLRTVNPFIEKEPPLLVLPEIVGNKFEFHYCPHAPLGEGQEKVESTINSCPSAAVYFPDYRVIVVHILDPIQTRKNLAHELVHAAFSVEGSCRISRSIVDLRGVYYQGEDVGSRVYAVANRMGVDTNLGQYLDFNEFFVPLGLAFLGEDYHEQDWLGHIDELQESSYNLDNRNRIAERISSLIIHLPQLAAEKLLDKHKGNLKHTGRSLQSYHQQANYRTNEFWLDCCMPLLYQRRF